MKTILATLLASGALVLAGCATTDATDTSRRAGTELKNAEGAVLAVADAQQTTSGVRVFVRAAGLPEGTYAVHVHTTGQCDPATQFNSAGGHWNPTGRQHGRENPQGSHFGDLPNLIVAANGQGSIAYVIQGAQLESGPTPMLDADGAAVVVHASPDDYRSDPAGNAGARIGCGVLSLATPDVAHVADPAGGHAQGAGH